MSENCILCPCRATEVQHAYTLAGEKSDLTKAMDMLQLRGRTSVIGDMDSQVLNMPSVDI
jgi:D-arabinose 1-dehydrogenase-like Zn-dependent alcohol dehydrogenase